MTGDDVCKLHSGNIVFWNDPDNGICSREYVIAAILVFDDSVNPRVRIGEHDGSELECWASELSFVQ